MELLAGITARRVPTTRLTMNVLERAGDRPDGIPVVLVHGNVSSSLFWQETMQALPQEYRVLAPDLRGFGQTDTAPVDASRGLRDFADDLHGLLEALQLAPAHVVGWSMGGGVAMQYALEHPVLQPGTAGAGLAVRLRRDGRSGRAAADRGRRRNRRRGRQPGFRGAAGGRRHE